MSDKKSIEGKIGYYGLEGWWLNTFTPKERDHIESVFQPMGLSVGFDANSSSKPLTEGKIHSCSQTITMFLLVLAGWFNNPRNRNIANKIITKANEIGQQNKDDILGNHFLYSEMISIYYPQRENKLMFDKAVEACKEQIDMASEATKAFLKEYPNQPLPSHKGYEQLAIILDKQRKHKKAISLCEQANEQGWAGNWNKRIDRYDKKLKKH